MASYNRTSPQEEAQINIPDIFVHKADDPEELPEYVPLRHANENHSSRNARRHRRSGVVNSMEDIRMSTSSMPQEDGDESEASFMSPGCSNSSEQEFENDISEENDTALEESDIEKVSEDRAVRPKVRDDQMNGRVTPPIYDETRPRRKKKFEPNFNPRDHLDLSKEEQRARRKVSFDTALNPQVRRLKQQARVDGQPVRKISLDAGLDAHNIRKVSFQSNPFESNIGRSTPNNVESIGQITFDAESGTLSIRKLSREEVGESCGMNLKSENSSSNELSPDDNIHPCDTPRKVSYADHDHDFGHINRGFQNDTYLDNVTFHVQRNLQNEAEQKNGHLFNENNVPSSPTKAKGILKGWKNTIGDNNVLADKDQENCQNSTLASHLRKDSIALTSEKLGQILDIQKHYKMLHNRKKRFGKQREILRKYQLQIGVAALFVLTVIIVSVGWHFHAVNKHEKMISQRIFFEAVKRNLNLADPAKKDDIAGKLGLSFPSWQLPSHCSQDGDSQEYQCLRWRGNAEFRIWYYQKPAVQCYNISWSFLNNHLLPKDCYRLGDSAWYGPSNDTNPTWTNRKINFTFSSSFTQNYDAGDFTLATENYWLSSQGVGIFFPRKLPLVVDWNKSKRGWVCFISNYTGAFYGNKLTHSYHYLNYTICNGNDPRATHEYMRTLLSPPPKDLPERRLLADPLWSTFDDYNSKNKASQKAIMHKALQINKANLSCSSIIIDGSWQTVYGDFKFAEDRFPNISDLIDDVKNISGCSLTLTFNPYFEYKSKSFTEGHPNDAFIKDASGHVPGLMKWDKKVVAMLDVTSPKAVSWLKEKISSLTSQQPFESFFLEYSSPNWIPYHPTFKNKTVNPSQVRELFSKLTASFGSGNAAILAGTSNTQNHSSLISVRTYVVSTEAGKCLTGSISSALTLGMLGYPFIMADGIYARKVDTDDPSIPKDLYIRWIQLASLFPAMKYSVPPWLYDAEGIKVAQNSSILHKKYVLDTIDDIKDEILAGYPIIRPIWWNDPSNSKAMLIEDEFLIGDDVLVAPVLCEGVTSRRVYFPDGLWSFEDSENFIEGNSWININVKLYDVPVFTKKNIVGSFYFH